MAPVFGLLIGLGPVAHALGQAGTPPAAAAPSAAPAPPTAPAPSGAPTGESATVPATPPEPSGPAHPEGPPKGVVPEPSGAPAPPPTTAYRDEGAADLGESKAGVAHVRYALQGIDVRGNTRTRDRVVLRYVPFHPGDVIDVLDPELDLMRYRLLGTGFFFERGALAAQG